MRFKNLIVASLLLAASAAAEPADAPEATATVLAQEAQIQRLRQTLATLEARSADLSTRLVAASGAKLNKAKWNQFVAGGCGCGAP